MKFFNRFKFIKKHNIATYGRNDKHQLISILEAVPQFMLLLDKNKYIRGIYNLPPEMVKKYGMNNMTGKHLSVFTDNPASIFYKEFKMLDLAFEEVRETGKTLSFEYTAHSRNFEAMISRLPNGMFVSQIKDISNMVKRIQDIERKSHNELSMALTAGGLTSWTYDVRTDIISSAYHDEVIRGRISRDAMIQSIHPDHRSTVTGMYDRLLNKAASHCDITIMVNIEGKGYKWYNLHAIPDETDDKGNVITITGSQKDVTAEHEHDEKLDLLNKQNELILNNINSALVYITPDYKVKWQNVRKVFNHPAAEKYYRTGAYCYESIGDGPCRGCAMQRALKSKTICRAEYQSELGTLDILANPVLNADNEVEGVILRIDDISERKAASEKLKDSEARTREANRLLYAILDNMATPLFIKNADDDYRYMIVNKEYCSALGIEEKDIIGKTDYDIYPKEKADTYYREDMSVVESGKPMVIESEKVSLNGGVATWMTTKTLLVLPESNKRLLIALALDITERQQAYKQLMIEKKRAEEADILKSAFLANMSHEIRTPLNAIVGFSELLREADNEEDKEEFWKIINTNNELLLRLIGDILDLSKIESDMIELMNVEFDMVKLFDEVYSTLKQRYPDGDVEFVCENPYRQCIVKLDKNRITQIITNFVTNAFKFTSAGKIIMGYKYSDNGLSLYCKDTGIGIAPEKIGKVFSRFFKLNNFAQGTGLGMAICKAISDAYNGDISVESEPGKGSIFRVWIPCHAEINTHDDNCENKKINSYNTGNMQDSLMKILIAEDNESNYFLVKSMLKGFDLTRAVNGAEAVDMVRNGHYDIVLMDIKMPVMDGLDATKEIRTFNNDIKIVALTANAFESDRLAALEAGCNAFLAKPISRASLFDMLEI